MTGLLSHELALVCLRCLLDLVELVSLSNQSLHLPQHPIYAIIFFCYLEDLFVLEVIKAIADTCSELLSNLALPLLPL